MNKTYINPTTNEVYIASNSMLCNSTIPSETPGDPGSSTEPIVEPVPLRKLYV